MSAQPPRALLRPIVAEFERRVNPFLDYAAAHPHAPSASWRVWPSG